MQYLRNKDVEIGHELIRSEVIFTPAKLERVEYIATTYGCPKCKETEEPQFIKDNGVPALLRGSYVSPSLAAHVICQKFMNAMPLYRQEKRLGTAGSNDHESFHGKVDHPLFQNILSANV